MVNLSPLSNLTTTATALANLILVQPKDIGILPKLPNGQSFLFHYNGEETVTLKSDITDHYIEDNTALQDQIALRPEMITTHGYIGELNDILPALLEPLKFAANKLTVISAYTPGLSLTALRLYNQATLAYATVSALADSAVSAWNFITGGNNKPAQNKQQKAFQQFYGYWRNRTLFTIQTPWAIFDNMAIDTLRAVQGEDTRVITDFEITFKAIRIATTTLVTTKTGQGRYINQSSPLIDNGTSTPPQVGTSISSFVGLA